MSLPVLPNSSNLVAVALVINRTRDGANLVFHYPPQASVDRVTRSPGSLDGDFVPDDLILERLSLNPSQPQGQGFHPSHGGIDGLISSRGGGATAPWETVTGFPAGDLATLMSPGRPYHKRLFQVSLDSLYYVSCPVHVPENGIWKKKKKKKKPKDEEGGPRAQWRIGSSVNLLDLGSHRSQRRVPSSVNLADIGSNSARTGDDGTTAGDAAAPGCEKPPPEGEEEKVSSMTMFNVVFILNPKQHEVTELVNALYSNIIKKLNKAYKYCQQHSDFVWKESKQIIRLKEKARETKTPMDELWKEIIKVSSLASSIQEIYQSLSNNRIISLQLDTANGPLSLSMQIPMPFYIPDLGPENETRQHGLWLTSANTSTPDEAYDDPEYLEKNFGLLLMDDEKKIISQLQVDLDRSTIAMVEFVRLCKPTMSLYQIGQGNILSHSQVRRYAHHFISWRRAIAIPPLHARDVYVMSPNCALDRLPRAAQEWQRVFNLAPPLTNFLAELSYAPRPYKHFCPSKAHRPTYLAMLAWLMRGGWVTQLCTFAYVVVWPEIIYEVEYGAEAEALRPKDSSSPTADAAAAAPASTTPAGDLPASPPPPPQEASASTSSLAPTDDAPPAGRPTSAGGGGSDAASSHTSSPAMTAAEAIAERARVERKSIKIQRDAAERATAHARKVVPMATPHPSTNDAPHLAGLVPYIVIDAGRATGLESRYLAAIGRRFTDEKTREAWTRFWRYFDGRTALERIALQEDMKRKEAWNLLTGMSEYLLTVRHW